MDPRARRQSGAHYTSEQDILTLLRDLFLDALAAELAEARRSGSSRAPRLRALHARLTSLRIFDPACGCGDFLLLAHRELCRLEQEIIQALPTGAAGLSGRVSLEQCVGIEQQATPAKVARAALVAQARALASSRNPAPTPAELGAPRIVCGNALRLDWRTILAPGDDVVIVGNPPFVGKQQQSREQKADLQAVWADCPGVGVLDYATCWFRRAVEFMQGTRARCALVTTNSLTQGEQVAVLWPWLHAHGLILRFARRSVAWTSDAADVANVHVVVIGFALFAPSEKIIHDRAGSRRVGNINPYLVDGPDVYLGKRSAPLGPTPTLRFGNMANDGGHLILDAGERQALLTEDPEVERWLRPFMGPEALLHGRPRWCLWLVGAPPSVLERPAIARRLAAVVAHRQASRRATTRELARTPALFAEIRQPDRAFLAIPKTGSERRRYLPMIFLPAEVIVSTEIFTAVGAGRVHFAVLSSRLHAVWMLGVGGRLKSDPRYSASLIYNNFPWPDLSPAQTKVAVAAAQAVLDARARAVLDARATSLATLYDAMPADLAKAHAALDRAIERGYRRASFADDEQRLGFLLARHHALLG